MARQTPFTTLDDIRSDEAALVGGKAFNCSRMMLAGIPVPAGVVITTAANETSLESLQFREWLAALPRGALLAVRSSGAEEDSEAHSFAGIHETRLNVAPKDVPEAVRGCWASAVSPAALAYRRARRLPAENVGIAVLIQRMIQPGASGVAFTVNPISGSTDELLINSVPGLGEALVSGQVEPDEFRIRKTDYAILSTRVAGATASLTNEQAQHLSTLLLRIEAQFGAPQDVEWCSDGIQFWIVQSRPVTSAATRQGSEGSHKKDIEWSRANSREILPELTSPMAIYSAADVIEQAERKVYGKLLAPESELGKMAQVFYGRLYFNLDQIRHICKLAGTAPAVILRAVGHEGDIAPSDELVARRSLIEVARVLPDLIRVASRQVTVRKGVREQLARAKRYVEEWQSMDFSQMSDRDLWGKNRKWRSRLAHELELVFTLTAVSTYEVFLRKICKRVGMPYERLAHTHLAAGEKSVSSMQAFDLLRLVQIARENGGNLSSEVFRSHFNIFLQKYGHRGRYESDIAMRRYVEDPSPLLFAVQSHLQSPQRLDPDEMMARHNAEAANAWQEFEHKLTAWQRLSLVPRTRWLLGRIKQYYVWRELIRSEILRLALPMRRLHLEMAERFVRRGWIESRDDYFYLTLSDVDAVIDGRDNGCSLGSIIARRRSEWTRLARLNLPLLIKESQLPTISRNLTQPVSPATNESELRGLCVSAGYAESEVVVMLDPGEFSRMKAGAILVAPATDPSWTPLFTLASGVIVEIGGLLSHASTIAREYGLPALANVKHATKILKDGERVRLDATGGMVQRLSPK